MERRGQPATVPQREPCLGGGSVSTAALLSGVKRGQTGRALPG